MDITKIRDYLLVATTIVTIIGVLIKTLNNFFLDIIKNNFRIIPAKQNIYDTVIKAITYTLLCIEMIIAIPLIAGSIVNATKTESGSHEFTLLSLLMFIVVILFIYIIISTMLVGNYLSGCLIDIFNDNRVKEIKDTNNPISKIRVYLRDKVHIINFINIVFSLVYTSISCIIFVILWLNYMGTEPGTDINSFLTIGVILLLSFSMFIISNSVRPALEVIYNKYIYIIKTKSDISLVCNLYFEYDEHYLVLKNGEQTFISKQEIKEIQKKKVKK